MSELNIDELKKGLTSLQVEKSRVKFGTNALCERKRKTLWKMFFETFGDIWIKVLCAALLLKVALAILSAFVPNTGGGNDFIEIASILAAIMLSTGFSTLSEYRNTSRSQALHDEYSRTFSKVVRDGGIVEVQTSQIVKGDVILIQAGDKIPADGLLFDGCIKVSQAALNGESRDEDKSPALTDEESESTDYASQHKVFMGSVVTAGQAYMVATVIGDDSELGKINKSITQDDGSKRTETSDLKLERVAVGIGKLGIVAAGIAGALHIVLTLFVKGSMPLDLLSVLFVVSEAMMLMASIIIMAVPEGLPMMNSLVQSMNTESMYEKHILVSHKDAFSDSAYMNILFSDKTGTITYGNLSLVEFINGQGEVVDRIESDGFSDAIALNNLARISDGKAIGSNNMDRALLSYAMSIGFEGRQSDYDRVKTANNYDSDKKCATAEMKDGTIYWKGASENILDKVTHYLIGNEKREFGRDCRAALEKTMAAQAARAMKLLSVARISGVEVVLMAVLCLRDDVRADAFQTVRMLQDSGIQVVMVTGDADRTAAAIAKEAGIFSEENGDLVLTHDGLESMSDEELKGKLPRLRVVSRAKPLDKKRLVALVQEKDGVCGMTGDGVNDAPALKQADVGFAMGDGTAVAQESGDVVVLNNSLTSIKDCILNSRTMAKSVGKFLIFQLTVNVCTLLMNIVAPLLGWLEPFSIVQILWINLIMDTLAAMAFGGEPALDRYMKEKPAKRSDDILTPYIRSAIATSAVFITLGCILILENVFGIVGFLTPEGFADEDLYARSLMFAFFIYSVIFNSFNTRSEYFNLFENISGNKKFVLVMGLIFVMQTLIIEFGGKVFSTTTLTLKSLSAAMAMALLIIPVDLLRKKLFWHFRKVRAS
ncbi:MAG TPA: cag pathogenicity island protein Cag3 [Spirochaetaceae bacterium]|nr:cag pathogenicity island protein Cag3 [Spirochaetaceae bacterium]